MKQSVLLSLTVATFAMASSAVAQQGVTKDEVIVGTVQDLSGPGAGYGKDLRNGMMMRAAEANDKGGVAGRKIKLLVEDSGFDPKRGVLATQKLVNQDKIFVMAGSLGTGVNNASLPIIMAKGLVNFFPSALSRDMYDPLNKLKFAFLPSYYEQIVPAVGKLYQQKKVNKACIIYQDDDYGQEILKGAEAGLKAINVELAERTSYKRGATDFSSQMARLKGANCDFVVLGTLIRETVGAIGDARKLDFNPVLIGAFAPYSDLIHKLGGKAMDGLYSTMTVQHPYEDAAPEAIKPWMQKYRTMFSEAPSAYSIYGYTILDRLIVAMDKAGADLTTDSLVAATEKMDTPADMFGVPRLTFSATKHLGSDQARLSQIVDGRWKVIADYE